MANLSETATYDAGVYQIEVVDPVAGGPTGIANAPTKNLANRTAYLKAHVDALEAGTTIPPTVAPLDSPTFTGDPKAPTPAKGDNDTSIATTAFVQGTVGGRLAKSVAGGANVTLTSVEAGNAILELSGALTASISVIVPTSPTRAWLVKNATTGAYTVTVKTSAGTGVVVTQGKTMLVFTDGTNVFTADTDILASILAVDGAGSGIDADMLDGQHASVFALLASPTFTGTPAAPTATAGTNTTQLATTAFVATAIANLIASSPSTLDTLNELAAALGDDPNFATTMTNALAAKAPLASPTFTGTPVAPTAAAGTSTTQIATTAFVSAEITADRPFEATATNIKMNGTQAVGTAATVARGDHVHPIDTSRAPLASPTFTGTPAAPTATAGTNTTQLATTAFVQAARGALQRFTANGTFTVPDGVTTIYVSGCAGGGGGGQGGGSGSSFVGAGGGGGGAGQSVIRAPYTVTPGQVIAITIGAGGTGGVGNASAGTNATDGGNTVIGSLITLVGGTHGAGGLNTTSSPSGGLGGAGYPGGTAGADCGNAIIGSGGGGPGASGPFGGGGGAGRSGTGGVNSAYAAVGYGAGGGGGGGSYSNSTTTAGGNGGAGAQGFALIEW